MQFSTLTVSRCCFIGYCNIKHPKKPTFASFEYKKKILRNTAKHTILMTCRSGLLWLKIHKRSSCGQTWYLALLTRGRDSCNELNWWIQKLVYVSIFAKNFFLWIWRSLTRLLRYPFYLKLISYIEKYSEHYFMLDNVT